MRRRSIPPETLLRAMLLQAFYSVRSERPLMERLEFDLLFRWSVGIGVGRPVWDHSTFSKNRYRLLAGEIAAKLLAAVLAEPQVKRLLSSEHARVVLSLLTAARDLRLDGGNELVAELEAADTVIIGSPMYNFGMASTLKAWFDHVLRAGITFRYTEDGPVGLLQGKRAIVIESRGGLCSEGPAQALDSQEPHLRNLLGFMGINDVTFVRAEKLAFGPEAREQAVAAAWARLGEIIEGEYRSAA